MKNQKVDFAIGGQALIEGVLMRSPNAISIAVRKKDGSIKEKIDCFQSLSKKYRILGLPLMRGIVNLFEMMVIGMRALNFSAAEYAEDFEEQPQQPQPQQPKSEKKPQPFLEYLTFFISLIISFALAIFLFKFIPLYITEWLRSRMPFVASHYFVFNLIEGGLRIALFILYIVALNIFKSFRRIFQYHGAEHMAVFTYEKGQQLTVENVQQQSPRHPRCGTSFLLVIFIISIAIYTTIPRNPVFLLNFLQRIIVIPIIAAIGYEILKWSAKRAHNIFIKILVIPGLLTQYLTTKKPDSGQIEVAIHALKKAVETSA